MAVKMNLVDARTSQRLVSWLVDMLPLLIISVIFLPMISAKMILALSAPQVLGEIAGIYAAYGVLSLGYTVFLWWWEATAGKTIGNLLLGLRTTTVSGAVPGWGKTIGRRLLIAVAGIIPLAGPVLMVMSNHFDANGKKQGWHDKAAGTLVLDIKAGRDPLTTGGTSGPASFAPQQGANAQPAAAPAPAAEQAPKAAAAAAAEQAAGNADAGVIDSVPGAIRTPKPQVEPAAPAVAADPDEELGHTRIRSSAPAALHLRFDDLQCIELSGSILLGRNPSYSEGDVGVRLVVLDDPERSVSKTHLLIQPGSDGVWVTDRHSGNGSAIVDEQGNVRELEPGTPEQALVGHTVRLGDRAFQVERA